MVLTGICTCTCIYIHYVDIHMYIDIYLVTCYSDYVIKDIVIDR